MSEALSRDEVEWALRTGFPDPYGDLARYNAERYRGIVHAPEVDAVMAEAQRRYDGWMATHRSVPLNRWHAFRWRHPRLFTSCRIKYVPIDAQRPARLSSEEQA